MQLLFSPCDRCISETTCKLYMDKELGKTMTEEEWGQSSRRGSRNVFHNERRQPDRWWHPRPYRYP